MKKNMSKNDPFENLVLDEEEQQIEEALERGEFESVGDLEDTKKMLADAAKRYKHLNTSKPITIRVNQLDLIKLKAKAKAKNIPYQTLLSSLIRDFADGDYTLKI
jgi:predicted DNA binding CopG/RHH family protein